jgi:hypothetical protein
VKIRHYPAVLAALAVLGAACGLSSDGSAQITSDPTNTLTRDPDASISAGIPVYELAEPIAPRSDFARISGLVRRELARCPLHRHPSAALIRSDDWLGTRHSHLTKSFGGVEPFHFYSRVMMPVRFDRLSPTFRGILGLRKHGSIDSPPLIYRSKAGVVLIRPKKGGGLVHLAFACGVGES